jgi:hypothetical protein
VNKLLKLFVLCLLCFCFSSITLADVVKHPFMVEKTSRTPGQLIQDIRAGRSRVTEQQFVERLKIQGFTVSLLDELVDPKRVVVKDCSGVHELEYIGSKNGFGTHFRACKPGENTLWFDGRPAISLYCGNVIHSRPLPIPPPQKHGCIWKDAPTLVLDTDQGLQPFGGMDINTGNIIGGLSNPSSNRTQSGKTCIPKHFN